MTDTVAMTRQT